MGSTIGALLPEAIGVAISPVPIIAVVLLLSTPRSKRNAFSFLLGWLVGLAVVGALVLLLADPANANTESGPATWVGWLILALGLALVLLAMRSWRTRPRDDQEPPMPRWMAAIDGFSPGRSLAVGFALAALNPKNLTLTLAAAAAIATSGLDQTDSFLVLAVFVVIGSLGLVIPIAIYFLGGDDAAERLAELHQWLAVHNAAIIAVLCLVIGAKLIGNGMQALLP